jgi:hypothetical protein
LSAGSGSEVLRATADLAILMTTSVSTSRWNRSSSTKVMTPTMPPVVITSSPTSSLRSMSACR